MVTALFYAGLILLMLLSMKDFNDRINKRSPSYAYYSSLGLFLIINSIVFSMVCAYALSVDVSALLLNKYLDKLNEKSFLPLLLAFAYYGAGTTSIPLAGKAVSIYGTSLEIFQNLFSLDDMDLDRIKHHVKKLNTETTSFYEFIEDFNDVGLEKKWDLLFSQWKDIKEDKILIEEHVRSLTTIREELEEVGTFPRKNKVMMWISEKIDDISVRLRDKLKRHVVHLISANAGNEEALHKILSAFDIPIPYRNNGTSKVAVCMSRAGIISFFMGTFIAVYKAETLHEPAYYYMLPWMFSLGAFGAIFSLITTIDKKNGGYYGALAVGGIAGVIGQALLTGAELVLLAREDFEVEKLSYGFCFGAALGLLIHFFKNLGRKISPTSAILFFIAAVPTVFCGLGFVLIGQSVDKIKLIAILGLVVGPMVAFATNMWKDIQPANESSSVPNPQQREVSLE